MTLTPTQRKMLQSIAENTEPYTPECASQADGMPSHVTKRYFLIQHKLAISPSQLSSVSGIPHPTVKQYLKFLHKNGLVAKPMYSLYVITDAGRACLDGHASATNSDE